MFVGDKVGHIGVWDATECGKYIPPASNGAIRDGAEAAAENPTEQDSVGQTYLGKHWHWRVHTEDKAVSCLRYRPGEPRNVSCARPSLCPVHGTPHSSRVLTSWVRLYPRPRLLQLYSSSHDCTMRVTDLETGVSEEILDGDYLKEDCYYHSFDFSLDGNQLWGQLSRAHVFLAPPPLSLACLHFHSRRQPRRADVSRHARAARGLATLAD